MEKIGVKVTHNSKNGRPDGLRPIHEQLKEKETEIKRKT